MKETVLQTLEKSGLYDALSRFDELADKRQRVQLKVAFAKEVEHLMPEASKSAFEVAERYAKGLATDEELDKASADADRSSAAADSAANDADADWVADDVAAARAARAAWATWAAAAVVAYAASDDAVIDTTFAAVWAVAANAAANSASYDAARSEMEAKQVEILKQFLKEAL